jgi:hypothetical protein
MHKSCYPMSAAPFPGKREEKHVINEEDEEEAPR